MNIKRRTLLVSVLFLALAAPAARAATLVPFDAARFEEARGSGKPVVLEVTATWCGPCQRLRKTVDGLLPKPELKDVVIFDADFDAHKDALLRLNAYTLTTLVVYRGKSEVTRASGETRPDVVETILKKAK